MAYSPDRNRGDDRYARDRRDDRGGRRRSRSRERDHDRDRNSYYRRDRSYDRYDSRRDDRYDARRDDRRSGRRDRSRESYRNSSRERKRSRERSPVRDRRNDRGYYRDSRDAYDNRDSKRARYSSSPRRDDRSRDTGRDRARDRDRDRDTRASDRSSETPRPSSRLSAANPADTNAAAAAAAANAAALEAEKQAEEKKKEERRAKMEAWKAKLLAKNDQSSTSVTTPPTTADSASKSEPKPASKPDPKEIQKRLRAAKARQEAAKNNPLGGDVPIPTPSSEQFANNGALGSSRAIAEPAKLTTKVTGFGLNKATVTKTESQAPQAASTLDEEDTSRPKLGKLPHLPSVDVAMDTIPDPADDDEDGNDLRSNDDADKADRQAAQNRAQQAEQAATQDVGQINGSSASNDASTKMDVDEEEDDPLDAYMNSLTAPAESDPLDRMNYGKQEATVFNGDDEPELDAVGNVSENIATMMKKSKKKGLPAVDHDKMNYQDFRKNFYAEPQEISEMTEEDVEAHRADLDNITVKGKNVPRPIQKFAQGGFGAPIMKIINDLKFTTPSAIQSQALPAIMSGRDTIGGAKTGSGKTMAFVLPMFRHVKDQRPLETLDGPIGLIMAPTRELAVQIHRDCKPFLKALNLRAVCAYGGAPIKDQIAELKRGTEIIVATPGRLIDLLTANNGRVTNLRRVTYTVMDEADRMFDMGFEPQIGMILKNIRPDRQSILFSATFPPKLEVLARKALRDPVEILVGGKSVVASEITQIVEVREPDTRFQRLLRLLFDLNLENTDTRCLIFVERQETADALLLQLKHKSHVAQTVHGGRDQIDRDEAIANFKRGDIKVLIATSVAARGLDVKQLSLVVNYDCPNHTEDYVHRCGRTGRAGNTGTAVTFVTPNQERYAAFLVNALTESKQDIPEDLKAMAESFNKKVESGELKRWGAGFGGRGIEHLDKARKVDAARISKAFRAEDQPDDEEDKDSKKDGAKGASGKTTEEAESAVPAHLDALLKNAMNVQKAEPPPPSATQGHGRSGGRAKAIPKMDQVRQAAMSINTRVDGENKGTARAGQHADNHGPDAGAFHATLEINDFPQRARWAVTNRTNTSKILDMGQVSITTKGNFYENGQKPAEGDLPKLYILVEGPTKVIVEDSMAQLVKLLKDNTVAHYADEANKPQAAGRYSVV